MDFDIANVDFEASEYEVTKAIAAVLHTEDVFLPREAEGRLLNFKVKLNPQNVGVRNDGTGILTLPSHKIGHVFKAWYHREGNLIKVGKKKLRFYPSSSKPLRGLAMTLDKTLYIDPDIEETRQDKIRALSEYLCVIKVQIGLFYRPGSGANRTFSVERELDLDKSLGYLFWEYEHKLLRVRLGNNMTEEKGANIVIKFSNIRKWAVAYEFGNPFICFDLVTPPMLEEEDFNRAQTGDELLDNKGFRRRVGYLDNGHQRVAPYCHHLRLVLDRNVDLDHFIKLCGIAEIRPPVRISVDAVAPGFCSQKQLYRVQLWLRTLEWRVAFQLEAILHNALLNTDDLLTTLYEPINTLCREHGDTVASEVLRHFTEALQSLLPTETPLQCFSRTRARKLKAKPPRLDPGNFQCHHVCFAPTRMILEGPYVIQSNRVIREWSGYEDNFIRVDFRDEDRLQYRWDREVDGKTFLDERVGGILKNGFELAGRRFEFLAYSSSALREHAVWFIHPFCHPEKGYDDPEQPGERIVNANYIRARLGEFKGVIHQPSKYAARIAQAFTATDPSVKISRDQWEEVPDLGSPPYYFTDGVGTISKALGDWIWETLCAARHDHGSGAIQPSAYQIRFLGYKGVVAVDEQIEGIKMRLRPSMNKFRGREDKFADIEIANAFTRPNTSYTNRSMIMILEDRGVKKESFVALQETAVADARTVHDSLRQFQKIIRSHSLGASYRLDYVVGRLIKLGLDLRHNDPKRKLQDAFFNRLQNFAMTHVLRDIKHGARFPILKSYLLVGVADEGPAYEQAGSKNVYSLPEGKIFACIQNPGDDKPTWLKGSCTISRSPVVHPGDIQRVFAIGEPPEDKLCLFKHLKNVVVLPSVGPRSLGSCLGGGDLDGDLYDVIFHSPLLPTEHIEPASYPPGATRENEGKRASTVDDICDFIVEYINSDVLGLLSNKHLVIADQSKFGTSDEACLKLAGLCSKAVDYPKNGIPVDIAQAPRFLMPYKPDWHAAEVASPRKTDYYFSPRALGELYRAIELDDPADASAAPSSTDNHSPDPISLALQPVIDAHLGHHTQPDGDFPDIQTLLQLYVDELAYICLTHTLTSSSDVRLKEEEIVVGTILAKCSQRRWRKDRMYRMRTHSHVLVHEIQRGLMKDPDAASPDELKLGILKAWTAWNFSLRNRGKFGVNSFGLIALGVIFDCLDKLDSFSG